MAGRRRRAADQIIAILHEHTGETTAQEILRWRGVSLHMFYRWRRMYGGVDRLELYRLQALDDQSRRLNRLVATTT